MTGIYASTNSNNEESERFVTEEGPGLIWETTVLFAMKLSWHFFLHMTSTLATSIIAHNGIQALVLYAVNHNAAIIVYFSFTVIGFTLEGEE